MQTSQVSRVDVKGGNRQFSGEEMAAARLSRLLERKDLKVAQAIAQGNVRVSIHRRQGSVNIVSTKFMVDGETCQIRGKVIRSRYSRSEFIVFEIERGGSVYEFEVTRPMPEVPGLN
jgi:hypothetical protein